MSHRNHERQIMNQGKRLISIMEINPRLALNAYTNMRKVLRKIENSGAFDYQIQHQTKEWHDGYIHGAQLAASNVPLNKVIDLPIEAFEGAMTVKAKMLFKGYK